MTQNSNDLLLQLKLEKLKELERKKAHEKLLPHLYGQKFFWWQRLVWDSSNKHTFLTCANQCGKSAIAIKRSIRMATDKDFQKTWWPDPEKPMPTYSFYFLPSLKLATREVENKWVPEFLPRGLMKDDPVYGWELEYRDKEIYCIRYKNGHTTYFMAYSQKASDLQASSPAFVTADEEMPMHLWGEISARLVASKGPFLLVCTPTLGELHWQKVFEQGLYPTALVVRATMYDCLEFEDGSPGTKTREEIEDFKAKLPTKRDVEVRVYGRFAKAEGLVYPTFDATTIFVEESETPPDWELVSGIDIGNGGSGHPAAFCVIAIRPDKRFCKIIKFWHGGLTRELTSNSDILEKYQLITKGLSIASQYYDWHAKDFGIQAQRQDIHLLKAEKDHEIGEGLLNTLFKNRMIVFELNDQTSPYRDLFVTEFSNLKRDTRKKDAKDESCDIVRYALAKVPFDTTHIDTSTVQNKEKEPPKKKRLTRDPYEFAESDELKDEIDREMEFWNEQYGT